MDRVFQQHLWFTVIILSFEGLVSEHVYGLEMTQRKCVKYYPKTKGLDPIYCRQVCHDPTVCGDSRVVKGPKS